MRDEELVRTYIATKSTSATATHFNVPAWKVTSRLRNLRKAGVEIPKFGWVKITPEDVNRLNDYIRTL